MPLPTLVKAYNYPARNQIFTPTGTTLTDNRTLLLGKKNLLLALSVPPQVRGSSDSTTASLLAVGAAGPGTDRWDGITKLVWNNAGSAHSWIVLRWTSIATNYETLLTCENASANGTSLTVLVSPSAGFTGGSTTARPTATDEFTLRSTASWGHFANASLNTIKLNCIQSSDGQVTRLFSFSTGVCIGWIGFEKPQNPVTGWNNPSASIWLGSDSGALASQPTYNNLYSTAAYLGRGTGTMTMFLEAPAAAGAVTLVTVNRPNDLSTLNPEADVGLFSNTASHGGHHGKLFDIYWGIPAVANGTSVTDPSPPNARLWDKVGDFWLPSNGVELATS